MSNPVTNVEIEDVLSSIRRLVAEGEKTMRDRSAQEEGAVTPPGKLVLTPAHRVPTEEAPAPQGARSTPVAHRSDAQPAPVGQSTRPANTPQTAPDENIKNDAEGTEVSVKPVFDRAKLEAADVPFDRASLEATIAELEAAVNEQQDDFEPDGSEVIPNPDAARNWAEAGFKTGAEPDDNTERHANAEDDEEAARWDAAPVAGAPRDVPPQGQIIDWTAIPEFEPSSPAGPLSAEGETETSEAAAVGADAGIGGGEERQTSARSTEEQLDDPSPEPSGEAEPDEAAPNDADFLRRSARESVAKAVAAHIARQNLDAAPTITKSNDDVAEDESSGDAPEISFRHNAPDTAPQAVTKDDAPISHAGALADPGTAEPGDDLRVASDDGLDEALERYLSNTGNPQEDALRELVHEMVRDELRGQLGERITRNVRRLVRREIHRMLTSQDFD